MIVLTLRVLIQECRHVIQKDLHVLQVIQFVKSIVRWTIRVIVCGCYHFQVWQSSSKQVKLILGQRKSSLFEHDHFQVFCVAVVVTMLLVLAAADKASSFSKSVL